MFRNLPVLDLANYALQRCVSLGVFDPHIGAKMHLAEPGFCGCFSVNHFNHKIKLIALR